MNLLKPAKKKPRYTLEEIKVLEDIRRKRLFILIHSCLYYYFDKPIISDHVFDRKGRELSDLQNRYPHLAAKVRYAKNFKNFSGDTGYNLPYTDGWVIGKAMQIWHINQEIHNKGVQKCY